VGLPSFPSPVVRKVGWLSNETAERRDSKEEFSVCGRRSTALGTLLASASLTGFDPPKAGCGSGIHVHQLFLYIVHFAIVPCIKSVLQTFQLGATKYSLHSPPLSPTISVHSTHSFPHRYPPRESSHLPKNGRACLTYTHQRVWPISEPRLAATKRHLREDSIRVRRRGIGHRVSGHLGRDSVSCVRVRGR
jgi:hypothetical protein